MLACMLKINISPLMYWHDCRCNRATFNFIAAKFLFTANSTIFYQHIKLPMCPIVALTVFTSQIWQAFTAWQTNFIISLQVQDCLSMSLMDFSPNLPGGWSRLPPRPLRGRPRAAVSTSRQASSARSPSNSSRDNPVLDSIIKLVCAAVKAVSCEVKTDQAPRGHINIYFGL